MVTCRSPKLCDEGSSPSTGAKYTNNALVVKVGKGARLRSGRVCRFEACRGHQFIMESVMYFKTEELRELIWEGETDNLKLIRNEITGNSRWSIHHEIVFLEKTTNKLYITGYLVGATEQQDERPFQYDGEEIECSEAEAYEKTVTDYRII
jgi:hypothetical protein